jgi:hypothetical protein
VDNASYNAESGCDCNEGFVFVPEGYNMCVDELACADDLLFKTQKQFLNDSTDFETGTSNIILPMIHQSLPQCPVFCTLFIQDDTFVESFDPKIGSLSVLSFEPIDLGFAIQCEGLFSSN